MKDCLMHADISPFTGRPEKGDEISRVIKRFLHIKKEGHPSDNLLIRGGEKQNRAIYSLSR